jgi:hypothetical protein
MANANGDLLKANVNADKNERFTGENKKYVKNKVEFFTFLEKT